MMGKYASKVIAQAQAWLGKNEADGSHREIVDIYNSHQPLARGYKVTYTDPWCATFVSAVAVALGYTDIIPTECSCSRMVELLKKIDSFVETDSVTPSQGWILFYDWEDNGVGDNAGSPDHVGFVEAVDGNTLTIIEGNYCNSVKRRTMAVNGRYIRGYGVPKYDAEPVAETKTITQLAREVLKGKWGNGATRKANLTAAGYDYDAVQREVNRLVNSSKPTTKKSNEEIAKEVIQGKWGVGADRKNRLTQAGYDYNAIQAIVNKLL